MMDHSILMLEAEARDRYALLYIEYIAEGIDGDILRGQIHQQITHLFDKCELGDAVDNILHNLDVAIGLTPAVIEECKHDEKVTARYGKVLADRLRKLRYWGM